MSEVRKGTDVRDLASGYYVAWVAGVVQPEVCRWNSRDARWTCRSIRVEVTHYEDRPLPERRPG